MTLFLKPRIVHKCGAIRKPTHYERMALDSTLAFVGFEHAVEDLYRIDDPPDEDLIISLLMTESKRWHEYLFIVSFDDGGIAPTKKLYIYRGRYSQVTPKVRWPRPEWIFLGIQRHKST